MKVRPDAVPNELRHNIQLILCRMGLDNVADLAERNVRTAEADRFVQTFFGDFHEAASFIVDVPHQKRCRAIAVKILVIHLFCRSRRRRRLAQGKRYSSPTHRYVDVDDVSIGQRPVVGDPVADHIVHRSAHRLREAGVPQWRWISIQIYRLEMDELVDFLGCDAYVDDVGAFSQDVGRDFAASADAVDLDQPLHFTFAFGGHHGLAFVVVGRFLDVIGHWKFCGDATRLHNLVSSAVLWTDERRLDRRRA